MNEKEILKYNQIHINNLKEIFNGKKPIVPFFLKGINTFEPYLNYSEGNEELKNWIRKSKHILQERLDTLEYDKTFRPLILEHWIYGVHLIDAVFGAEVSFQNGNWWSKELSISVGSLTKPDISNSTIVKKILDFTTDMVDQASDYMYIGMQVLSSPLNIAINLFGQRFLETIALEPEYAQHDLEIITETIIDIHNLLRTSVPKKILKPFWVSGRFMPEGYGIIDGCTTQLISAGMYREIISELDNRILQIYPEGGMIHICGSSEQHIPVFKEMKALKAVQLNDRATNGFEKYYKGLRDDQVIFVEPNEAVNVNDILKISDGGKRVIINCDYCT